jgi:FixJ family two-component response regulator
VPMQSTPQTTVAVIDDDQRVLASLGNLLASAGYRTELFACAEAFFLADPARFRCVITDLGMRPVDGLEVLRRVRAATASLPVIIITGKTDIHPDAWYLAQGAAGFYRKPVDGDELMALIGGLP